ncbi:prolyl oligopeptidase family serine peptidase [Clostridium cellulovorans]|uniref:alpha/beta hydrolase family protein n=1 Tax=Clostridium cellulovorans TaxID=1493 RepID=UPI0012F8425D
MGKCYQNTPPCVIIHGTIDDINPISASELLVDQLKKSNIRCELNAIEGENHFYENDSNSYSKIEEIITKFLYNNVIKK